MGPPPVSDNCENAFMIAFSGMSLLIPPTTIDLLAISFSGFFTLKYIKPARKIKKK
jgi:hypothetical protein